MASLSCIIPLILFLAIWTTASTVAPPVLLSDPISAQPRLVRPDGNSCTVSLFSNANLSSYSELLSNSFALPSACPGPWAKVILDFTASEVGTQYDRFGAVWINEIELLRTTTPEPTSEGIHWFIEKDITIYGDYLQSASSSLFAYLSIPNNVDSTYTGFPLVNISLTFYSPSLEYPAENDLPIVLPLTNAVNNGVYTAMQVVGNQSLEYSFKINPSDARNTNGIVADVYASAHGCEEFYYTNVPSENASAYGLCGGGVYREIQVYIDGVFAGAVLPFPVIYTGGINPFLWRPLTGIMSFDIPSHHIDLSPFLGSLIDGAEHSVSFTVLGNNEAGLWYLDASLLLIQGASNLAPVGGEIDTNKYFNGGSIVDETTSLKTEGGDVKFFTKGRHSYSITGNLLMRDGSVCVRSVVGDLNTVNYNFIVSSTTMRTIQNVTNSITSTLISRDGTSYSVKQNSFYPLATESYYNQNSTTFDMQAIVDYDYGRSQLWEVVQNGNTRSFELLWSNKIATNATYNRTLDHTTVYVETDRSHEEFKIESKVDDNSGSSCYNRKIDANNGYIVSDKLSAESCKLPAKMSFCGFVVCGLYDSYPAQMAYLTVEGGFKLYTNEDIKSHRVINSLNETNQYPISKLIRDASNGKTEVLFRTPRLAFKKNSKLKQ